MFHDPDAFARLRDKMRDFGSTPEPIEVPPVAELIARIEAAQRRRGSR